MKSNLFVGLILATVRLLAAPLELMPERMGEGDLEIIARLPEGRSHGFVARDQLLGMALVTVTNTQDLALNRSAVYQGIYLDDLMMAIPGAGSDDLLWALCRDHYAAYYTPDYRRRFRPILVLRLDGKDYADWPVAASGVRMSPFYISCQRFVADPANTLAGQAEHSKIPYAVVGLRLANFDETIGRLKLPTASGPSGVGQNLALRECLSCHFKDDVGGRMSGKPWLVLAAWARADPEVFQKYVKNPRQVEPTSRMPGFPDFSPEALFALQAYFSSYLEVAAVKD